MLSSPGREVKGHPFSGLLSQSGEQTRMWAIILLGAELICIWPILSRELADAHEMANVFGIDGLTEFMNAETELDIFHAIPSSVPSTTSELETTGGLTDLILTHAMANT